MSLQVGSNFECRDDSAAQLKVNLRLGLTAATILYFELLLIRWVSTEINIFAYLQNSILVVCFLGLGMGLLYPKPGPKTLTPSILCFSLITLLLAFPITRQGAAFISTSLSFFHDFVIWDQTTHEVAFGIKLTVVTIAIVALLILSAALWGVMVPLGQSLGASFQRSRHPLLAYSFDIGGSLFGIWLYTILGYFSLPPVAWIGVGGLLFLPLCERKMWPLLALLIVVTWYGYKSETGEVFWTPYQKIQISPAPQEVGEYLVTTNNSGYQQIQNNASSLFAEESQALALSQYDLAARLHPQPQRILIAGVGTGNDLAGALRRSPNSSLVGVEIDPVLYALGRRYHPEKPYEASDLQLIVDDARAAFHSLPEKSFQLVITGLLDSHTTPNLSNARLDNFVYTKESISAAARLLSSDGVMVISFSPQREYIVERLRATLDQVFGQPTRVFQVQPSKFGWGAVLFVNGNQESISMALRANPDIAEFIDSAKVASVMEQPVQPSTDDWPYMYIERPMIPSLFYVLAAIVPLLWGITSFIFAGRLVLPPLRKKEPFYFFTLGIGFIVIQVFIITKASLLFGSTWIVNSIVISGMMLTILVANLMLSRGMHFPVRLVAGLLLLVCLGLAAISFEPFLSFPLWGRCLIGLVLAGIPTFLSGIMFGSAFAEAESLSEALGANLFGALVGAMLQSIVFLLGISSLAYLGALAYALALVNAPLLAKGAPHQAKL
jgi:spermidine synthase